MKVETLNIENHQVKLAVEVDSSSLESAKHKAARKIARQIKIPGFRPGKAPYPVVLRQVGEASVLEEAIETLVEEIYPDIIKTANIEPFGPGSLDKIVSTDPPKFEFIIPLKATVVLGDYKAIREDYAPEGVNDDDIQEILENLRIQHAIIEPIERSALEGDIVQTRLNAHKVGEEESDPLIKERTWNVLIESEAAAVPDEWPFPGFSRLLIDQKAGDRKQFTHKFDGNSPYETLRNAEAIIEVEVIEVRSRILPAENNEFAQSVGDFSSLDELRQAIRESLERQSLDTYHSEYDEKIIKKMIETATINFPPQMLEREIDSIIENLVERLEQQGLSLDLYLKSRQLEMQGLREETKEVAETRLKKTLVLLEAVEVENIQVDPEELQTETEKTLGEAYRSLPQKDYRRLIKKDKASNLVGNIMMDMLIQKTRERLRLIARGVTEINDSPASQEAPTEPLEGVGVDQDGAAPIEVSNAS